MVRAQLPLGRHSGGVADAVVGKGAIHVLSTGRLSSRDRRIEIGVRDRLTSHYQPHYNRQLRPFGLEPLCMVWYFHILPAYLTSNATSLLVCQTMIVNRSKRDRNASPWVDPEPEVLGIWFKSSSNNIQHISAPDKLQIVHLLTTLEDPCACGPSRTHKSLAPMRAVAPCCRRQRLRKWLDVSQMKMPKRCLLGDVLTN